MSVDSRYSRHLKLAQVGPGGQARLAAARVLLVGLGGLGAPAAIYLASSGIGRLLLNDFDRVDESNLARQVLYRDADVGQDKVTAAAARLAGFNPALQVSTDNRRLDRDGLMLLVQRCDVVLDGTDNFATRELVNECSLAAKKPLVSGAAIRFEGQLGVFRPDIPGQPCYRCLYDSAGDNLEDCAGQGILAPVAGTVGTLMATEAIKVLLGIDSELTGRLWLYDGLAGATRSVAIPRRPDCPACGRETGT